MTAKESWKPVTIGGVTGILMGAGAMYAAKTTTDEETDTATLAKAEGGVKEAATHDEMSFGDAFESARTEVGAGGVFRWHGNIYNTYTAEEWKDMHDSDKQAFAQRVSPEVSAEDIDTNQIAEVVSPDDEQPDVSVAQDTSAADGAEANTENTYNVSVSEQEPAEGDDDVRVVGSGHVQLPDGHFVAVEELDVNGQRVAVIDVDNDGVGDIAMSDLNHNQLADEGEIIDLHTGETLSFTNSVEDDMLYASDASDATDVADIDATTVL